MALRDTLEAQGLDEEEVEARLAAQRVVLNAASEQAAVAASAPQETHASLQRKESELASLRSAFGLADEPVPGQAFDRELQEKLKAERLAQREAAETAKAKAVAAAERHAKAEAKKAKEQKRVQLEQEKKREKEILREREREREREKEILRERERERERDTGGREACRQEHSPQRRKRSRSRRGPRSDPGVVAAPHRRSRSRSRSRERRSPAKISKTERHRGDERARSPAKIERRGEDKREERRRRRGSTSSSSSSYSTSSSGSYSTSSQTGK